jgi:hypothetical protein
LHQAFPLVLLLIAIVLNAGKIINIALTLMLDGIVMKVG